MEEEIEKSTPFQAIYDCFLDKITDDMYLELTKEDTLAQLEPLLYSAIPYFEFPKQNLHLSEEDKEKKAFPVSLTMEEINIIAVYMCVEWIGQQLDTIDNTRMKYSGQDFKFTSQANHMQKLQTMKKERRAEGFHLQRLYKRRKVDKDGHIVPTIGSIMERKI